MSTTLPVVNRQPELVDQLLQEQQHLSAVEQFSDWHTAQDGANHATIPSQEKYYRSLLPATAPGPNQQLAFEVNLDSCSGCKACVVACHTMNGLEEDESWRRVGTLLVGDPDYADAASIQHVTTACHHCEDPGCLNGCPVKAYEKDPITGIVRHLDDQCIGCKYCTMMCPYEVPQYSDRLGIVRKCDMCHQRLSVGEAPACVQSCPNEAIKITIVPTGGVGPSDQDSVVPTAPSSAITQPTTRYVTYKPFAPSATRPQDENFDKVAESHWPLAVMLVATQISVGVLVAELLATGILMLLGIDVPDRLTLAAALIAFVIGNMGLGIAPLHLGQPLRMWRVFLGLKTSWLSREAVVLGQFMGLLAGAIAILSLPLVWDWIPESIQSYIPVERIPDWAGRGLLAAAIPVGLVGLYSSAMIYIATKRQLWRSERTFPRFFGTMLIGGPVIVAVLFAFSGFAFTSAMLCLAAAAAGSWKWTSERRLYDANRVGSDSYDRRSKRLIDHHLSETLRMRSFCSVTAIALAILAGLVCVFFPAAGGLVAAITAVVFIAGENLERLLYFQSVVYDRMPGTL
jgi:Fe-S-cluster-containing dehydrogenase component/DMSO reductase anchor subunit